MLTLRTMNRVREEMARACNRFDDLAAANPGATSFGKSAERADATRAIGELTRWIARLRKEEKASHAPATEEVDNGDLGEPESEAALAPIAVGASATASVSPASDDFGDL